MLKRARLPLAELFNLWNGIKDIVRQEVKKSNKKYLLNSSVDDPFPAELLTKEYWLSIGTPINAPQVVTMRLKKPAVNPKNSNRIDLEVGQLGNPKESAIITALQQLRDFSFDPDSSSCKGTPKDVFAKFVQ